MTNLLIRWFIPHPEDTTSQDNRGRYGVLGSMTGIVVNLLLAAAKFVVGILTGSVAVTADASNNLSDAGGSIVSLASIRIAQKPVDRDHPFGHGRMEYLGAMGVGVLILLMGFELLKSSVMAIFHPEAVRFAWVPFGILLGSILMKGWLYFFYKKVGSRINSATLLAASKDSLSDVMATSAVALSMALSPVVSLPLDGIMGTVVALLILKAGWEVCKDTMDSLLGGKPDPAIGEEITRRIMAYDNILGVHDLIVHDYGPGRSFASVHAEVPADGNILTLHEIIDRAEHEIGRDMNIPVCIHMDPVVTDDEVSNKAKQVLSEALQAFDSELMLHDFRRVPGEGQINLVFDVVLPAGYKKEAEVRRLLEEKAAALDSRNKCVIQFDPDYWRA